MTASLSRVTAIATNTFKEALRNRVFLGLLIGALAMILCSLILSQMVVFDQERRVVQDFGLFFISFAGVVIAIVVGVLLVYKELQLKTIYSLLSKPIHRWEFIVGRYAGMFLILVLMAAIMASAWVAVMLVKGMPILPQYGMAVILVLGELAVVGAVAILFSSFSTPILSGIFTFGVFVLGRLVYFIDELLRAGKGLFVEAPSLRPLARAVVQVFPDLSVFDVSREIVLEIPVTWTYVGESLAYAACYVLILLVIAALAFSRRDFV